MCQKIKVKLCSVGFIIFWITETCQTLQKFTALGVGAEMTSECSNLVSFHPSTETLTMFIQDDGITIWLVIQLINFHCVLLPVAWTGHSRLSTLGVSLCLCSLCRSETIILEHYGVGVKEQCQRHTLQLGNSIRRQLYIKISENLFSTNTKHISTKAERIAISLSTDRQTDRQTLGWRLVFWAEPLCSLCNLLIASWDLAVGTLIRFPVVQPEIRGNKM